MNILFWNYRGVASDNFLVTMFDLLCIHNPYIVILVEPKYLVVQAEVFYRDPS